MIPVSRIREKLKRFYYRRSIQDIEAAIATLETSRLPQFWSFWHGGPVNGWPRVSVDEHLENLHELKEQREAWLDEATGGAE